MIILNICILSSAPFPPKEGIGNYIYNLSKEFVERGENVTIITRGGLHKTESYIYEGIKIMKPPFIPLYPFHVHIHGLFVGNIFKYMKAKTDIIHIHSPLSPIINTKLPIISTFHTPMKTDIANFETTGLFVYESKAQVKISCILENQLLKRSDLITVVSKSVFKELEKEYNVEPERMRIVHNGVDDNLFYPLENNNNSESSENKYILFVGRLTYRKGLFDLIYSAKYIKKKYPNIRFIIVGNGHLVDKIKIMIKNLGLENNVIIKGFISKEELVRLYQNATIYVVPSHYEGLPTVLLEAMSCGLAVIATAISGNLDVIIPGENGILVPIKSPKELAYAISNLLENENLRIKLGKNARKTVEENYTWKIISNRIMGFYIGLVK